MNGMMKRTLGLSLVVASLMVATPAVAMFNICKDICNSECTCEEDAMNETKKGPEIEVKDKKEESKVETPKVETLKTAKQNFLKVKFVAACKATKKGITTTSSWFAKIFTNFFSWISNKFTSGKNAVMNLKFIQRMKGNKVPQTTVTLNTVAQTK